MIKIYIIFSKFNFPKVINLKWIFASIGVVNAFLSIPESIVLNTSFLPKIIFKTVNPIHRANPLIFSDLLQILVQNLVLSKRKRWNQQIFLPLEEKFQWWSQDPYKGRLPAGLQFHRYHGLPIECQLYQSTFQNQRHQPSDPTRGLSERNSFWVLLIGLG